MQGTEMHSYKENSAIDVAPVVGTGYLLGKGEASLIGVGWGNRCRSSGNFI